MIRGAQRNRLKTLKLKRQATSVSNDSNQKFSLSEMLGMRHHSNLRKTKIICSLGKACNDANILKQMILMGMNLCRINSSLGLCESFLQEIAPKLQQAVEECGIACPIMMDTTGTQVRIGLLEDGQHINMQKGENIDIGTEFNVLGNKQRVNCNFPKLLQCCQENKILELENGEILVKITKINHEQNTITVEALNGGRISQNKYLNFPSSTFRIGDIVYEGVAHDEVFYECFDMPSFTDSDIALMAKIKNDEITNIDFLCISDTTSGQDIKYAREQTGGKVQIIAKINSTLGIQNFEEIIDLADGSILVRSAIGGVLPVEKVSVIQKKLIMIANARAKPVVVSSQMLESMTHHPVPTRAETSDTANAVLDGADALCLVNETAIGEFPIDAVNVASQLCLEAEMCLDYKGQFMSEFQEHQHYCGIDNAVSMAVNLSFSMNSNLIICFSQEGKAARYIQKFKPFANILAVTSSERIATGLRLQRNIYSVSFGDFSTYQNDFEGLILKSLKCALQLKLCLPGQHVVLLDRLKNIHPTVDRIFQLRKVPADIEQLMANEMRMELVHHVEKKEAQVKADPLPEQKQSHNDVNQDMSFREEKDEQQQKSSSNKNEENIQQQHQHKFTTTTTTEQDQSYTQLQQQGGYKKPNADHVPMVPLFRDPQDPLWDEQKLNNIKVCFPVNLLKREDEINRDPTRSHNLNVNVQKYFEKNQLTQYFEKLLKAVMINQPDNPVDFLIQYLEKEEAGGHALDRLFLMVGVQQFFIKGVAKSLKNKFQLELLSLNDLLKDEVKNKGKFAAAITQAFNSLLQVPDDICNAIIDRELQKINAKQFTSIKGVIITGYPNNIHQSIFMQGKGYIPEKIFIFECENIQQEIAFQLQNNVDSEVREDILLQQSKLLKGIFINDLRDIKAVHNGMFKIFDAKHDSSSQKGIIDQISQIIRIKDRSKIPLRPPRILILRPEKFSSQFSKDLCRKISQAYDLNSVSTNNIIKGQIDKKTQIGSYLLDRQTNNQPISSDVLNSMVLTELETTFSRRNGWVLEGYPKSAEQMHKFVQLDCNPSIVISLEPSNAAQDGVKKENLESFLQTVELAHKYLDNKDMFLSYKISSQKLPQIEQLINDIEEKLKDKNVYY